MRIASLDIKSYKSFLQPVIMPLSAGFNVFIGPNNCGKTNILDGIAFLANPNINPERFHHHRSELKATIHLDDAEQRQFNSGPHVELRGREYEVSVFDQQQETRNAKLTAYIATRVKNLYYDDFSDYAVIEKDYSSLSVKHPETFKRMTSTLSSYFPEIRTARNLVDIDAHGLDHVDIGGKSISIERLGGGFRRVFVILLYAFHPDYSVVLLDEPEIHLHPSMIKKVVSILMSGTTNQIIATSHSPLVIRASNLEQIYRVLRTDTGSRVFYLNAEKKFKKSRLVQELNADNLEMFFADKVLLVEGVSDKILMRGLIDRFYTGNQDIKVIDVHGKTNIDVYMDLMQRFHIPYLVMLDRDALKVLATQFGITSRVKRIKRYNQHDIIRKLHERHIYILPNGTIERNYPRKYQNRDSKPLNALVAAARITKQEYLSSQMKNVRLIVNAL